MTMNNAPSRVRAVARVGPDPSAERGPVTFGRRRRHGYLGSVNVLQLVLLEGLVVMVLILLRNNPIMLIGGIVLSILVLVATFARSGGRWWVERALIRRLYNQRHDTGTLPTDDMRLLTMHRLVPDLTVETIDGLGGTRIGVGRDGAGSFAAVAVMPSAGMNGDPLPNLPLGKLAAIAKDAEQPGSVLQVVTHLVPTSAASADAPTGASYRNLVEQYQGAMPADQVTWVAVRFDARTVAEAAVGGADDLEEIPVMLALLVRRVTKALKRAGLECQVLDGDGLLDALARSCDLEQPHDGSRPPAAREAWTGWQSANLVHSCFWVNGWPDLRRSGELLAAMGQVPAALTSIALILAPCDDLTEIRCLVRVAAEPDGLEHSCGAVRQAASRVGARLFRLDGEQAPGVYATAPTGGGAR